MDDSLPIARRLLRRLGTALGVCLCCGLVAAEGDAVRLAYKFQPSESLHLEYKQDMTVDIRQGEFKERMRSQTVADKHLRVISVDAKGNALVEPVIDRTRMTSRQNEDAESKFDSDEGPDNCPAQFKPLLSTVGKPQVRIKFAPTGKLLVATSIVGDREVTDDFQKDPTLNFLIVFPDEAVRVGDTWKDEFEAIAYLDKTLKQGVKLRREYRLSKLDDSRAEIELKTVCLSPLRDPKIEMQIANRLLNGTIVFDHQLGQIVSREMRVESQVINAFGDRTLVRTLMTQSERAVPNPKLSKREELKPNEEPPSND